MSRLAEVFEKTRRENRAALVIYLCAGDPSLELTPRLVLAASEAGADVVELGVPFSDPTADGPTIQRASERALKAGATLAGTLEAVREVRRSSPVPIVLFGYYNPILRFGEERLAREAKRVGVDGLLVVDLPPESAAPLLGPLAHEGLDFVPLIAPTSTKERIDRAASIAGSFLYYVSMTGVTGSAGANLSDAARRAAKVRDQAKKPVAVGFGVRTPEDVAVIAAHADGVVVGSALVDAIHRASDPERAVRELVHSLASATRR